MKILFVGDVVGRAGRGILKKHLSRIKDEHQIELTIVNVENAAGGFGVTESLGEQILGYGVDVMTSGNHIWDKKEVYDYFTKQPRLLRPGNYPPGTPGDYLYLAESSGGLPVAVMNFQGRVFMPNIDCPFRLAEREVSKLADKAAVTVIDFHAEATSEKMAMGWYLDGRVSVVVGTHTHVATADERILPDGTAYLSDLGMTGCYNSILGMKKEKVLNRFLRRIPESLEPATGPSILCGAIIDVDESSGRSRSIDRVTIKES